MGLTTGPSHALMNALDSTRLHHTLAPVMTMAAHSVECAIFDMSFCILSSMPANHAFFTDTLPRRPPPCCWRTTEPLAQLGSQDRHNGMVRTADVVLPAHTVSEDGHVFANPRPKLEPRLPAPILTRARAAHPSHSPQTQAMLVAG
jgi:hypothetical protein